MLNTTNKNEGKFWFNLFHELGHILLHGKRDIYISFDDDEMTKKEKEADNFAEKMLIGNFSDFSDFKKANNLDNQTAVRLFARKKKISPAIVAGIFTHKYKKEGDIIYRSMDIFLKDRINYYNYEIVE
jgi:Zn-dependent peptidase ImmA (M78 family)